MNTCYYKYIQNILIFSNFQILTIIFGFKITLGFLKIHRREGNFKRYVLKTLAQNIKKSKLTCIMFISTILNIEVIIDLWFEYLSTNIFC